MMMMMLPPPNTWFYQNELKNIFTRNQFDWDLKWFVCMFHKHFYECLCWEKIMVPLTTSSIFITPIIARLAHLHKTFSSHMQVCLFTFHWCIICVSCSIGSIENSTTAIKVNVCVFFLWSHQKHHTTFIFVQQKNVRVGMCFKNGAAHTLCTRRRLKV